METTRERARMPSGTEEILNRRTLASSHRRLDELLRSGMRALDIGCGTGAITRGMFEKTDPGIAIGLDINLDLVKQAGNAHPHGPYFVAADLYRIPFGRTFDLASAARVIQWLSDPCRAIESCLRTLVPGGRFLVLDYNHEKIAWDPVPPSSVGLFYEAFLAWRTDAGMDNAVADHLFPIFERLGLNELQVTEQHEHTYSDHAEHKSRLGIWAAVAATRGRQMVNDGYLTELQRAGAEQDYCEWMETASVSQTLYLLAVEGQVP